MKFKAIYALFALSALGGSAAIWHSQISPEAVKAKVNLDPPAHAQSVKKHVKTAVAVPTANLLKAPAPQAVAKAEDASLPTIYASMIYNDNWWDADGDGDAEYGYYSFQPTANPTFTTIVQHPNLYINGGGAYSSRRLHYHLWEMYADEDSDTGITFHNYFCVVNTDEWSMLNYIDYSSTEDNIAYDMTYDPVSGKLYAVEWGPFEDTWCYLVEVEKISGEVNIIAKIPEMVCLASDNFGRLFGVGRADGITYYIDKTNGNLIALGASGVMPKYMQSATCDPATNVIYWAAVDTAENSTIRTIDTNTGEAKLIGTLPGEAELTGLFIEASYKGSTYPAEPQDVRLSYADGRSTLKAVAPSKTFAGKTLSGDVTLVWYVDGVNVGTKTVTPGTEVEMSTAVSEGNHTVVVYAQSADGVGAKVYRSQWCGNDVPAAPGNVVFTLDGTKASLSWTAPTVGLNGGTLDASSLTYEVKRMPGEVIVAKGIKDTTFSETLPSGMATYYYTVTASTSLGEGGTATSNTCQMGEAFTVPYYQPFDTQASTEGFTIISNETGRGWYWWNNTSLKFQAMACKFNMNNASDHWLIMPSIVMKATSSYKLKFKQRVFSADDPEKFEVTIGRDATVASQTKQLMGTRTVKNEDWQEIELPFTVSADGTWNIGFHCVSPVKSYYLLIDDISIVETASQDGPLAVSNLTATAGAGGALTATLSFTAPTKTYGGATLTSLSSIKIYRGDEAVACATIDNPVPGETYQWTDNNAVAGNNTYRVAAYNGDSAGQESTVSVYVGYDTPNPVTNAKAVATDDGVVVSWTAPTTGISGGTLNQSELTYTILDSYSTTVATGVTGNTYTDTRFANLDAQAFVYYQIHAVYGSKQSSGTLTDFVVAGPDNDLPFSESFSEAGLDNTPWALSTLAGSVTGCWTLAETSTTPAVSPFDSDGGMAMFKANELPSGCEARLTSPKMDLMTPAHPVLTFYVYLTGSNARETLSVEMSHNDNVYVKLADIDLTAGTGWTKFSIEIPRKYCDYSSMVAFRAKSGGYGQNICLDKITVTDSEASYDTDLQAVDITIPDEMMPGENKEFIVTVFNNGKTTATDYTVSLLCDGVEAMSTKGAELEAGVTMQYIFKAAAEESDRGTTYKFSGKVAMAGDQNPANDVTEAKAITVGVSGVKSVVLDGVSAIGSRGCILVSAAEGADISVYTLDGARVANSVGKASTTTLRISAGFYIVKVGNRAFKVRVQ